MAQRPGGRFPPSMIPDDLPSSARIRFEILLDAFWVVYYSIAVLHYGAVTWP